MSTAPFSHLLNPETIAVIGASNTRNRVGTRVFNNILKGGFKGAVYPVNPRHQQIQNHPCFRSVKDIQQPIDLAIITTPAPIVSTVLAECGEAGISTVLIISAGFGEMGEAGKALEQSLLQIAQQWNIRMIGPNCLGIMRPALQLNATFNNKAALPGKIAFLSQSGALCATILDWAHSQNIGFSALISLGNTLDVDFGELLSYLAQDTETQAILLYVEGVHQGLQFMQGLRCASAQKPVIVLKAGRYPEGSQAASSHTGALMGDDDVFTTVLRQTGALRVMTLEQLFAVTQILASTRQIQGKRLTVITNGGGAGVLAVDKASELGLSLPPLNKKTLSILNQALPLHWSHHNPIDLIGDATAERYHEAVTACLKYESIDALLVILIPVAMSNPRKIAEQVIKDSQDSRLPVLTCWMGASRIQAAHQYFRQQQIPSFTTPETAIEAFACLAAYSEAQQFIQQAGKTHKSIAKIASDLTPAHTIIQNAQLQQRKILTTLESKALLELFSIPTNKPLLVSHPEAAQAAAESIGFPVVMKIHSESITHKKDVGGVMLNLHNRQAVADAFQQISQHVKSVFPELDTLSVTIEKMYQTESDRELIIGAKKDPVYGPVMSFGAGGTLVEIMKDRSLALPPLNPFLAQK